MYSHPDMELIIDWLDAPCINVSQENILCILSDKSEDDQKYLELLRQTAMTVGFSIILQKTEILKGHRVKIKKTRKKNHKEIYLKIKKENDK